MTGPEIHTSEVKIAGLPLSNISSSSSSVVVFPARIKNQQYFTYPLFNIKFLSHKDDNSKKILALSICQDKTMRCLAITKCHFAYEKAPNFK